LTEPTCHEPRLPPVDEILVRVAVEELDERGALDRDVQCIGVSAEVEERRHEVDPDRRGGFGQDLIEGGGQRTGAGGRRADHSEPACAADRGD